MLSFLLSGFAFLLYAYLKFIKTKIFYPSVVFSLMWGIGCIVTSLILGGYFGNLYLSDYYSFNYMDEYMPYFTVISIFAFYLAHKIFPGSIVNINFKLSFIAQILKKFHWIMWLNFFGGIFRIILMVNVVGLDSVMDYRVAANTMMNTGLGPIGLVFRITSYVQMLANFYIALAGFKTGFGTLNLKQIIYLFILYSPTQLATGGRLFILYFILFFIGSFILGRGFATKYSKYNKRVLLTSPEKKILLVVLVALLSLVSLIALARNDDSESGESALAKFTYISEGILETEHYMRFSPPDKIVPDFGKHLIIGSSPSYLQYRGFLRMTFMSSIVLSIISPLYSGFGYWGSIIVWGMVALLLESSAIICLRRLTIIRFFVLLVIIKIMYESIISNSLHGNIPVYELIILFCIFYKFSTLIRSR